MNFRFFFVILRCGEIMYVYYLLNEDLDVIVIKKGFVVLFVLRLYEEGDVI